MFKVGLSFDLAQKIVDNIMTIVPYNINIMDKSGTIIASGNKERIDNKHSGAVKALEQRQPYYIYQDTELERKGINVPFRYKDEIIGVIGVSGEPKEVESIANIVRVTAELMIEKQFFDNKAYAKQTQIRDFFNELLSNPLLQQNSEFQTRAKELDIDWTCKRIAVIIKMKESNPEMTEIITNYLRSGEYVIHESTLNAIIFFLDFDDTFDRIKKLVESNPIYIKAFVGFASFDIHQTYESAVSVKNVVEKLSIENKINSICDYILEDLAFQMKENDLSQQVTSIFKSTNKSDALIETLIAYINCGLDITKTCDLLFIHKNTLYYRMQKLSELTGFDTKNIKDLIILYLYLLKS